MNWRSVRIQTDGADIAIVPNSVVAKLQIVNRSVPNRDRAVSAQLWCPARADPERVVEVLQEATLLCPPILETPAPSVTLTQSGMSAGRAHLRISARVVNGALRQGAHPSHKYVIS